MQKEIPFSNINNTEYTNLINGFKVKPKIINKALSEKLNLFSDNENIKCKFIQISNSRKMTLTLKYLPCYIDES